MAINNINGALTGLTSKTTNAKTAKQDAASESSSLSISKGAVSKDTVNLTDHATSLSSLQQKITDAPDTNESKVANIKAAIERGDYKINADRVASKMLAQENALFGDNA